MAPKSQTKRRAVDDKETENPVDSDVSNESNLRGRIRKIN